MRPKYFIMSLATVAGVVALLSASPRADTITLTQKAAPIDVVVEEIAKQSGQAIKVSPAMKGEIVLVHVKDRPVKQLLDELAKATTGMWTQESDALTLIPDTAQRRRQAIAVDQKRLEEVRKGIANFTPMLKAIEDNEKEEPNMFGRDSTGTIVVAMLGRYLPSEPIAALKSGERIVFSSAPNGTQRLLPNAGSVNHLLADWIKARNTQIRTQMNDPEMSALGELSEAEREMMKLFMRRSMGRTTPITTAPAKLLLIVECGESMYQFITGGDPSITLKAVIYDSQGEAILTSSIGLDGDSDWSTPAMPIDEEDEGEEDVPPGKEDKGTPIKFSEETTKLMSVTGGDALLDRRGGDPEAMEILANPDKYEPLAYSVSEALMAVADAKKLNLVAALPDEAMGLTPFFSEGLTVESVSDDLESSGFLNVATENGTMVISAKNADFSQRSRANRVELAKFINKVRQDIVPSLDDLAALAASTEDPFSNTVSSRLFMLFAPGTLSTGFGGQVPWKVIRLYGQLSPGQRQAMRSGQPISFGSLSAAQGATVRQLLFGTGHNLQILDPNAKKPDIPFLETIFRFMESEGTSYKQEPTEIMPNGLPAQGQIQTEVRDSFYAIQVGKDGKPVPYMPALGEDELALIFFMAEDPKMSAALSEGPDFDNLKVGVRKQMELRFLVASDVASHATLIDDGKASAQAYKREQLPADMLARINEKKKLVANSPLVKMMMMGFGETMGGSGSRRAP